MARAPAALRVSFDLDDTLICDPSVPCERHEPLLYRWRYPERLRAGTRRLLRSLHARGCRLWLYTSSGRSERYLASWFGCLGVPLEGIVNRDRHDQVVGVRGPSKYPPAFNIGLHVDDSEGVAMEARAHGFHVVVVSPRDPHWADRVLAAVETLRRDAR